MVQSEQIALTAGRDVGDGDEKLLETLDGGVDFVDEGVERVHLGEDGRLARFWRCRRQKEGQRQDDPRECDDELQAKGNRPVESLEKMRWHPQTQSAVVVNASCS